MFRPEFSGACFLGETREKLSAERKGTDNGLGLSFFFPIIGKDKTLSIPGMKEILHSEY